MPPKCILGIDIKLKKSFKQRFLDKMQMQMKESQIKIDIKIKIYIDKGIGKFKFSI